MEATVIHLESRRQITHRQKRGWRRRDLSADRPRRRGCRKGHYHGYRKVNEGDRLLPGGRRPEGRPLFQKSGIAGRGTWPTWHQEPCIETAQQTSMNVQRTIICFHRDHGLHTRLSVDRPNQDSRQPGPDERLDVGIGGDVCGRGAGDHSESANAQHLLRWPRGRWGWRGFGAFGEATTTADNYRLGVLVVDLFDADTKKAMWRGDRPLTRFHISPVSPGRRVEATVRLAGPRLWKQAYLEPQT